MAAPIHVVAILSPKEGKVERVVEILSAHAAVVKESEPGTLKYEVNVAAKPGGGQEIVMVEIYKDKAALNVHSSSEAAKNLQKTIKEEGLMAAPLQLKFMKAAGGFSSRI